MRTATYSKGGSGNWNWTVCETLNRNLLGEWRHVVNRIWRSEFKDLSFQVHGQNLYTFPNAGPREFASDCYVLTIHQGGEFKDAIIIGTRAKGFDFKRVPLRYKTQRRHNGVLRKGAA